METSINLHGSWLFCCGLSFAHSVFMIFKYMYKFITKISSLDLTPSLNNQQMQIRKESALTK